MKLLQEIDEVVGKTIDTVDPMYPDDTITITFTDDTCIRLTSCDSVRDEITDIEVVQESWLSLEQKLTIGLISKKQYEEQRALLVARKNLISRGEKE